MPIPKQICQACQSLPIGAGSDISTSLLRALGHAYPQEMDASTSTKAIPTAIGTTISREPIRFGHIFVRP